jgi:hypothetical protein
MIPFLLSLIPIFIFPDVIALPIFKVDVVIDGPIAIFTVGPTVSHFVDVGFSKVDNPLIREVCGPPTEPKTSDEAVTGVHILIIPVDVKGFIDDDRIPALNVSRAVAVSVTVFLKYNKFAFAIVNVCAPEFDASKTSLSKIGRSSVGGKYDAIINK